MNMLLLTAMVCFAGAGGVFVDCERWLHPRKLEAYAYWALGYGLVLWNYYQHTPRISYAVVIGITLLCGQIPLMFRGLFSWVWPPRTSK